MWGYFHNCNSGKTGFSRSIFGPRDPARATNEELRHARSLLDPALEPPQEEAVPRSSAASFQRGHILHAALLRAVDATDTRRQPPTPQEDHAPRQTITRRRPAPRRRQFSYLRDLPAHEATSCLRQTIGHVLVARCYRNFALPRREKKWWGER